MTIGPAAASLDNPDDPYGWHDMPDPAPRSLRRRRRIDVTFGSTLTVDAMFRDSHYDDERAETVVHEYGLVARVDLETSIVTEIEAEPHVLPYVECPTAAGSAQRMVGLHLDELRDHVRAELVGTTTCTHLNDLLRSLADVRGIVGSYHSVAG